MELHPTARVRLISALAAIVLFTAGRHGQAAEAAATVASAASPADANQLVVHEWGTFTSLQDEEGNAIGGINVDDEPVPDFVHRIASTLVISPRSMYQMLSKSIPRCHPDVTMRLETPVVYFHPARGQQLPTKLDVDVAFRGGWLSEYYPTAAVEAPGISQRIAFGSITADTLGRLSWKNLLVGTDGVGPETTSKVWLAPRAVDAANVSTPDGESERYLFYRGIGHVDSPVRVSRDSADQSLILTADFRAVQQENDKSFAVPAMWLVETRDDKSVAFRRLDGFEIAADGEAHVVGRTSGEFAEGAFDQGNLDKLTSELRSGLIEDGLYADEAEALLQTWTASYFQTPGLRLFYLVPPAWTDRVLPITLSADAKVVRTMVGRVEIVTPRQRELLNTVAAAAAKAAEVGESAGLAPANEKATVPAETVAYQQLGRFRNALVLDHQRRRPNAGLQTFITKHGLTSYVPSNLRSAAAPAQN